MKLDTLSPVIMQSARLTGQSVQRERKDEIENALAKAKTTDSASTKRRAGTGIRCLPVAHLVSIQPF